MLCYKQHVFSQMSLLLIPRQNYWPSGKDHLANCCRTAALATAQMYNPTPQLPEQIFEDNEEIWVHLCPQKPSQLRARTCTPVYSSQPLRENARMGSSTCQLQFRKRSLYLLPRTSQH